MPSETISEARWKVAIALVGGLVIAAVCGLVLLAMGGGFAVWFGFVLGAAMIVLSILTMVRPAKLVIDRDGFSYGGGWTKPKRFAWSDIEDVYIMRRSRGGDLIGVKYRDGRRPHGLIEDLGAAMGVDDTVAAGWTLSLQAVVARLNAWRTGAV